MRPRPSRDAISHVCVVQTAFLGDVLLTLPLMHALRTEIPHARLTLVTTPAAASFVEGLPMVDRVIVFDKRGTHRGGKGLRAVADMVGDVDALLVPHKSLRTARLVHTIRSAWSVTYADAWSRWVTDTRVRYPLPLHDADRHFALLRMLLPGVSWTKERCIPLIMTDAHDRTAAHELVADGAPYVVLAPGTVWPTKQWPFEHVRALAARIVGDGMRVVIIGDASVQGVVSGPGVIDLAGRTTMRQAAAVIRNASAVVANDSAPLHVASLQNVPVVGVFGPTVADYGFGPFGTHARVVERTDLACRPCSAHGTLTCPIGTHECMRTLDPGLVHGALAALLHAT